MHLYSPSR